MLISERVQELFDLKIVCFDYNNHLHGVLPMDKILEIKDNLNNSRLEIMKMYDCSFKEALELEYEVHHYTDILFG